MALQVEMGSSWSGRFVAGFEPINSNFLRVDGILIYSRTTCSIYLPKQSPLIKQQKAFRIANSRCGILINFPFLRESTRNRIKTQFNSNFAVSGNERFKFVQLVPASVVNGILNFLPSASGGKSAKHALRHTEPCFKFEFWQMPVSVSLMFHQTEPVQRKILIDHFKLRQQPRRLRLF